MISVWNTGEMSHRHLTISVQSSKRNLGRERKIWKSSTICVVAKDI